MMYKAISIVQTNLWDTIDSEVQFDPALLRVIQGLQQGLGVFPGFSLHHGRLCYQDRVVLPRSSSQIPILLDEFHNTATGGHSGFLRTYKKVAATFYWKAMRKDIKDFVANCQVCQQNKYEALSPAGLLNPLPIPEHVRNEVSMDFISGLPRAKGVDTIMVVVDRLSKYAHFLALSHPLTTKEVDKLFIKEIVHLHRFPKVIISDRDHIFLNRFWSELFHSAGTKLKYSTSYHPQTDGQTDVTNRYLEMYLHCFVGHRPKQWPEWLN